APRPRRRRQVTRLEEPVIARLDEEAVRAGPHPVDAPNGRLRAVGLDEQRPVLDRGRVAGLDGLAEPDLGRLRLRNDSAHVGARVLELAEWTRPEHTVLGVERSGRLAV